MAVVNRLYAIVLRFIDGVQMLIDLRQKKDLLN